MNGVAEADIVGVQSHNQGMGPVAVAKEADALKEVARSNSASDKDDLLAGGQILGMINAVRIVDTHALHAALEICVIDHQTPDHFAMQASHGSRGDHAFGSSADSHHGVDSGATHSGGDTSRKIAIANQANAGSRFSNRRD